MKYSFLIPRLHEGKAQVLQETPEGLKLASTSCHSHDCCLPLSLLLEMQTVQFTLCCGEWELQQTVHLVYLHPPSHCSAGGAGSQTTMLLSINGHFGS